MKDTSSVGGPLPSYCSLAWTLAAERIMFDVTSSVRQCPGGELVNAS